MASGPALLLRCLKQAQLQCNHTKPVETRVKQTTRYDDLRRKGTFETSVSTPLQPCETQAKKAWEGNYLERLPCEITVKILSFLDASSLFSISLVNKHFHDLANCNALWYVLYASEITKKNWRPRVSLFSGTVGSPLPEEKPAGYWRKMLFREMSGFMDTRWKAELSHKNPYTGMPALTEKILRRLQIQWEITLIFNNGQESVYSQSHAFFEDSSVTVCWNNGHWPCIQNLQSLELHGVVCQSGDKPKWRSLICKTLVNKTVFWTFLAHDKLVKLLQFGKIIIGAWRSSWKIAFIMINLHFHKLIEKSVFGSRFCSYLPTEDNAVDPDSGCHGYTLHIALHNPVQRFFCQRFSPLYTSRGAEVQLKAIDFSDVSAHKPVVKISLPWQAGGLHGDAERPFWCVSSPVKMTRNLRMVDLEFEGEQFIISHKEEEGRVKMTFVWVEEIQRYFLVQLIIIFPVAKVKKHFGQE
ncbi:hypothetical protein DNTS_018985 [Danionella cerebrum]|uniref:F-box domain-containing protein n=1 Tax=Danionella cerebrum TaxID=2873325 RepID=A0A553QP30_9TELE|nr:hypothetical protein DNTS_018985 [Danionella translucida]